MFLQEGAFEKNFAAGSAPIALAATQRKGSDDLFLTEVGTDETTHLALRLTGAELGIFDGAGASGGCETFFQ